MMGDVSPETCWTSYKYWIIKFFIHCCILLDFLYVTVFCPLVGSRQWSAKVKYVSFWIRRMAQGLRVPRHFLIHVVLEETSIRFRNGHDFRSTIVPHEPVRMSCPLSVVVDSSQEMERRNVKLTVKFTIEQATKARRGSRSIALLFF